MGTCLLETAFSMDTSSIKFGPGVTAEVGWEMKRLGCRRVMVLTDPRVAQCEPVAIALDALRREHIDAVLFDQVHVEPTDVSFQEAIKVATDGAFDGYVAVGGGSSMDTAKAANLYATYPASLLAYVNSPIGEGLPVPGSLRPLVAIPTTTGTGSETTGVAIFDFLEMRAKTGIAHRALRPTVGLVDPNNTRTLPKTVIACSGFDVLSHGIESYTALPYHQRPAPEHPGMRPAYQGSNPISDIWATRAIEMVAKNHGPRRPRSRRSRSTRADADGCHLRRHRLRQCRLPSAARHVVPGLRNGAGLRGARLPAARAARPARHVRRAQRPGRLPLHRVSQPGAAPARGPAPRR